MIKEGNYVIVTDGPYSGTVGVVWACGSDLVAVEVSGQREFYQYSSLKVMSDIEVLEWQLTK